MSYPKRLTITFNIENQLQEYNLVKELEAMGGKYLKILPNTDHLKDNEHLKSLYKDKKKAEDNYYKFINNNR